MCLAIPAKLIECDGGRGTVDLHGSRLRIETLLVPEARPGDWVLVHAGFAIQRLDEAAARRTWALLDDLADRAPVEREPEAPGRAGP